MPIDKLFVNRKILDILDGDAMLDSFCGVDYKMPYLSGPSICSIGKYFGADIYYPRQGASSRWNYMEDLLMHCFNTNQIPQLLNYLFNKSQFSIDNIKKLTQGLLTADEYHKKVIKLALDSINDVLKLDNVTIENNNDVYRIVLQQSNTPQMNKLKNINNEYIRDIIERAHDDIKNKNYDSAITKSRTMLEEIFCYIIEKEGDSPNDSGKIDDLYKQIKPILNLNNNKNIDSRINGLISALNSIINNIASMRNISSDSHGVGSKRYKLEEYHAVLCVNSAMIVAEFLLSSYESKKAV